MKVQFQQAARLFAFPSTEGASMKLHSINAKDRLYVIRSGQGTSCYGFDVLDRKARAVAEWLQAKGMPCAGWTCAARDFLKATGNTGPGLPVVSGTVQHFELAARVMDQGAAFAQATGERCDAELTPALVGFEGQRVEVISSDGTARRFYVGKSSGWMPCHLEIKTRRSTGGGAVYLAAGDRVRVVHCRGLRG